MRETAGRRETYVEPELGQVCRREAKPETETVSIEPIHERRPDVKAEDAQYLGSCLSLLWTMGSCSTHEASRELSWLSAPPEWASRILSDGCRSNAPERIRRVMARVVSKGKPVASWRGPEESRRSAGRDMKQRWTLERKNAPEGRVRSRRLIRSSSPRFQYRLKRVTKERRRVRTKDVKTTVRSGERLTVRVPVCERCDNHRDSESASRFCAPHTSLSLQYVLTRKSPAPPWPKHPTPPPSPGRPDPTPNPCSP